MHTPRGRALLWRKPTGFAASHCVQCKAGWTRSGKDGARLVVCLLDREPVLLDMVDCDRYEANPAALHSAPSSARRPTKPRKVRPPKLRARSAARKAKSAGEDTQPAAIPDPDNSDQGPRN
jgi:hypothetical protein